LLNKFLWDSYLLASSDEHRIGLLRSQYMHCFQQGNIDLAHIESELLQMKDTYILLGIIFDS
jgi:hypothetical protein